jgi:hypothetical protein
VAKDVVLIFLFLIGIGLIECGQGCEDLIYLLHIGSCIGPIGNGFTVNKTMVLAQTR